jgi:hypothetical protein
MRTPQCHAGFGKSNLSKEADSRFARIIVSNGWTMMPENEGPIEAFWCSINSKQSIVNYSKTLDVA